MTLVIAREVKKEMHIVVCMRGENILVVFLLWIGYSTEHSSLHHRLRPPDLLSEAVKPLFNTILVSE